MDFRCLVIVLVLTGKHSCINKILLNRADEYLFASNNRNTKINTFKNNVVHSFILDVKKFTFKCFPKTHYLRSKTISP